MSSDRTKVPSMNELIMYTNHAIDNYPGYGKPVHQVIQNVQPYTSKVGLDPFPCNVPKGTQVYESHFPLGTQFWDVADSEWELKDANFYRQAKPVYELPGNPNTVNYLSNKGFSHTGFLGAEYQVPPTDPRYRRSVYGHF